MKCDLNIGLKPSTLVKYVFKLSFFKYREFLPNNATFGSGKNLHEPNIAQKIALME